MICGSEHTSVAATVMRPCGLTCACIGAVFPGFGVVVFLHDLMAKNNPRTAKSAAMADGVSRVAGNPNPASLCTPRNNLGVMARCLLGAGSALEKALKRARVAGSSWDEPETCKGLGWRLFLTGQKVIM